MKKIILRLLIGLILIPSLLVASVYHLDQSGFFNIDKIKIEVVNAPETHGVYLTPLQQELEKDLSALQGQSLWSISMGQVAKLIKAHEWVNTFQVHRQWPQSVIISVHPHEVQMILLGGKREVIPVIAEGKTLAPVAINRAPDVVIGAAGEFRKDSELRKKAIELLRELPSEGVFTRHDIAEITHNSKEGFWLTLAKSGTLVKMGDEHIAIKAARVAKVVDYLETKQFDARVIDANLSKKVLVRLRKDP